MTHVRCVNNTTQHNTQPPTAAPTEQQTLNTEHSAFMHRTLGQQLSVSIGAASAHVPREAEPSSAAARAAPPRFPALRIVAAVVVVVEDEDDRYGDCDCVFVRVRVASAHCPIVIASGLLR